MRETRCRCLQNRSGKEKAQTDRVETEPAELEESSIAEMPTPQAELEGRSP